MPPGVATLVFAAGIAGLFWLDRDRQARTSLALWIPVAWVLIAGSRMVSEWLQLGSIQTPDQYLDGSPLDRVLLTGLLAAGVGVLASRGIRVRALLRSSWPIVVFLCYCGLSVLWSDFPDVALKRWMKALGDIVMVLVVASESDPRAALKRLLARTSFVLIPLSVLLIKYYPEFGRGYNRWTWTPYYTGVSFGKNGLGYVCLVFGLASLWRFLGAVVETERTSPTRPIVAHGAILAMTLWLFWKADSATSLACFVLGASVLVTTTIWRVRKPMPALVAMALFIALGSGLFLDGGSGLVEAMGRDTTLTGRTGLWDRLLGMTVDPLFGTGFESFWLGDRVEQLWQTYWWHPNQAHNGYLELYLNLGVVGLALLGLVAVWGYRNIAASFRRDRRSAVLALAYFVIALAYNLTEAAFKMMHPVWIAFLLATVAIPAAALAEVRE
jgi:exopolysaccharide production protein ExoQ